MFRNLKLNLNPFLSNSLLLALSVIRRPLQQAPKTELMLWQLKIGTMQSFSRSCCIVYSVLKRFLCCLTPINTPVCGCHLLLHLCLIQVSISNVLLPNLETFKYAIIYFKACYLLLSLG